MSLASPTTMANFEVGGGHIDGMTIPGDILLLLGLPNHFGRFRSQAGLDADAEVAASAPRFEAFIRLKWGPRIHDVDATYFRGVLSDTVVAKIRGLYDYCMSSY